jgi:hypothetical protein
MATVNKDFKIKHGLVVEGSTATVNGDQVLTENASDQYILDLIGGETLVKSVSNEFDVSVGGELSIDRAVVDAYYDAAGSAANAQSAAEDYADGLAANYDPAGSASNAYANAASYADGLAGNYDPAGTANSAAGAVQDNLDDHTGANSAVHGVTGSVVGTTDTQDLSNKRFIDTTYFTDGVTISNEGQIAILSPSHEFEIKANIGDLGLKSVNYDIVLTPGSGKDVKWGTDIVATQNYVDGAVSDLVGAAPALLDTLEELATALQDNPNIIADLQGVASGKQNTLTAGSNIDITGNTISVTGLDAADISDFNTAALSATSAAYDAAGAAATAQGNAEDYADGLAVNYDPSGAAATALQDAKDYADAIDTDGVAEGVTNEYFTDTRAKASAADLLTSASLTNITITGTGAGLTITAENGVDDSTTDDLEEGALNLYFTTQRAVNAIDVADITPNSVEIANFRKEEATQQVVASASTVTAHTFTGNKSVKYLVRTVGSVGGVLHSQVTELLVTVDGNNNAAVTEYGTIYTSEDPLATATMDYSDGEHRLRVTTAISGAEVVAAATIMSWAD